MTVYTFCMYMYRYKYTNTKIYNIITIQLSPIVSLEHLCLANYMTLYKKFRGSKGYNQQQFCRRRQ